MPWRKKKDELSKKRDKNQKVPYRQCGAVIKTEKLPGGRTMQTICKKNANIPHGH